MRREIAEYEPNALDELYKLISRLNLTDNERKLISDYSDEKNRLEQIEKICKSQSINKIARSYGITRQTLWRRLKILKWDLQDAISTPVRRRAKNNE